MTLLDRELELYDFNIEGDHYRYVDGDRVAIVEGQTYQPARGLKRNRLQQSAEDSKNNLELTVPLTFGLLELYRPFPPLVRVQVVMKRVRVRDGLVRIAWSGYVTDVKEEAHTASIHCQTLRAAVAANALRRCWQVACPFALYSARCGVREDDVRDDIVLGEVNGVTLRDLAFAAHGADYYAGGVLRWRIGNRTERRFITVHAGDTLTLLSPAVIPAGTQATLLPGCDHTLATCNSKFHNAPNYGGQHTIPKKNPYGSDPVF